WEAASDKAREEFQSAETVQSPLVGKPQGPFQVRDLGLPDSNVSGRAIRPTDIAFTRNGDAWVSTLDGDVWRVIGLEGETATWTRAATGIYEATNIEVDGSDRIYVLGRDQITQLMDLDNDGFIDRYKNESDGYWQTLHTRDYAMSMVVEPGGSFVVAKGGIQRSGQEYGENSAHRGAILRVATDLPTQILADGLRIPFVGRRKDGVLFASDQQGHWVPSSPLYRIGKDTPSFGFEPTRHRDSKAQSTPPSEPEFWFPYQANRSGAGFATLDRRAFSGLGDQFIHVAWDGRLFAVVTPESGTTFGWRLPLQFDFPTLNGASHPQTGKFYAVGMGLKGYLPMTPRNTGLASVHEIERPLVPTWFDVQTQEIIVAFREPVPFDSQVEVVSLRMWNLKRSEDYGSGHYRWDGSAGEMNIAPQRMRLSDDRRRLVLDMPRLFRADMAVLHLQVFQPSGAQYPLELFTRPAHLTSEVPATLGPEYQSAQRTLQPGNATVGKQIMARLNCVGCHSLASERLVGPPLNGLTERSATPIWDHLRDSILKPNKVVTQGYPAAMPSYEGVITPQELEHLITYIQGLK
ncbi:MAG: mono/diheme cytochrome c family protein, partial [Planctomycetota bacterium]